MKIKLVFIIVLSCAALLTSCSTTKTRYPNNCWGTCHNYSQCKNCVYLPCEHTCSACTFRERVCDACWNCVSDDGCRGNLYPYNKPYVVDYTPMQIR